MLGLVGEKCGMTRIFNEDGSATAVTVIQFPRNSVTQVKTIDTDGYCCVQIAAASKRANRVSKPMAGHFAKAGVEASRYVREFRMPKDANIELKAGDELKVDLFNEGQQIDICGTSKGRGFAGAVKRHNFRTQDASHGNSLAHRAPGSIGQCQTPGRVFKGKKMAGHMGDERCTVPSEIIRIDADRSFMLVKGAVPGAKGGMVIITPAKKVKKKGDN